MHLVDKIIKFNPFKNINGIIWKDIRISKDGFYRIKKILSYKTGGFPRTQITPIINSIINIARGQFQDAERQQCLKICFSDLYVIEYKRPHNGYQVKGNKKSHKLVFSIQPRRIPLLNNEKKLIGFQFEQAIEIFPHYCRNKAKLIDTIRDYINQNYKGDHDQYECFNPNYVLSGVPLHKRQQAAFGTLEAIVDLKLDKNTGQFICIPKQFQPQMLNEDFAKLYKKDPDTGRFKHENEFLNIEDKFKRANDSIVETVSDEKGAEQLLRLIKSIPQLKFKLTIEQEKMISTPNNLLCLGRSGTGKTTSSALRLFSTDVFYKYMEELRKFRLENPDKLNQHFKVDPYFLNKQSSLKLVFVTFSPVLTNEVKKFYDETKLHFITELIKRREKKQLASEFEEVKESYQNLSDQDTESIADSQSVKKQEEEDFNDYLQLEQDLFQDDQTLEKQMKLPFTMDALSSDHFPLFATVRRLIYMLDASLDHSFFSRSNEGQIVGMDSGVEWHNENRGVFMINQYYKQQKNFDEKIKKLGTKLMNIDEEFELEDFNDIDDEDEYTIEQNNQPSESNFNVSGGLGSQIKYEQVYIHNYNITGRQLSFEIDFETFKSRFWPKVAGWCKLAPLVAWTEICSVIKGGAECCDYQFSALPFMIYIGQDARSTKKLDAARFLKPDEKIQIYQIFMHYEKWKQSMGAYDFNDVVNHIINQTRYGLKPSQTIHFLMVDEVQDLTPNILLLLTNITEKNIFFCGDTAQTIAKGVGFRFYDLKTIFRNNQLFSVPSVLQLAKNFRSHSKILDLANSVVSLIELLFPQTIDKLLKESSDLIGPKPIFIDPANKIEQLQSKCGNQWLILKDIVYERNVKKRYKDFDFINFESLDIKDYDTNYEESKVQKGEVQTTTLNDDEEIDTKLYLTKERGMIYRQYAQLCAELKFLYVAITRPKKILIIYDDDNALRKPLQDFWAGQQLISVVTKEMLLNNNLLPEEVNHVLSSELSTVQTSIEDWRVQGIMLFKKRFYHSAIQCFRNSQDDKLVLRCQAYQHADKAQQLLGESDSKVVQSKNKVYKKSERNQMKKEAKELKQDAFDQLEIAGSFFEKIGMNRHAAQCFCSAQKIERAAKMFESLVDYGQSAECYLKTKNYRKAAEYYAKAGLFANAFECYERLQDWEGLLMCLSQNKIFFKKEERESLIEKYFPIALNQLYHMYLSLDPSLQLAGVDEENRGKLQQMKIQLKFQKSISVIREEDENEDSEDSEEEENETDQKQQEGNSEKTITEDKQQDQSISILQEDQEEQKQEIIQVDKDGQSFEIIDTSTKKGKKEKPNIFDYQDDFTTPKRKKYEDEEEDIEIIEDGQEQAEGDAEQQNKGGIMNQSDQFEILSSLDPDDEFLQSGRSVSLIDSIISKTSDSFSIISGQSSEFSIIGNSKLHSIIQSVYSVDQSVRSTVSVDLQSQSDNTIDLAQNMLDISQSGSAVSLLNSSKFSTIQYERDSYAEDIIMQKIIFYVSLFSDEVKDRLKEMRSKDTLGHLDLKFDSNDTGFDNQFMLIDLDDISEELLYLILDTLEHYELFRLCLIICNRYQLKSKIARYLISIGNKYSNLKNFRHNFQTKCSKLNDIQAQQTYSVIAHEAMHNVLSLVEKDFLKIDEQGNDTMNLRDNCFDHLFLQGFWRKLVFLMDSDSSLQLCKAMNDKESFKLLYLIYRSGIKDGKEIREIIQNRDNQYFDQLIKKDVNKLSKLMAQEISISDLISNLERAIKESTKKDNSMFNLQKKPQISKQNQVVVAKARKQAGAYLRDELHKKKPDYFEIKKGIAIIAQIAQMHSLINSHSNFFIYNMESNDYKSMLSVISRVLKIINTVNINLTTDQYQENLNKTDPLMKIKEEILRIVMLPFGVHMIDGLDLFNKFNQQFCIVKRDSQIFKQINDKHLESLQSFNNSMLLQMSQTYSPQYNIVQSLQNVVKACFDKQQKQLDTNAELNKFDLAVPCDLNGLEYFLVPKQWVIDIVSVRISDFSLYLFSRDYEDYYSFAQNLNRYTCLKNIYKSTQFFAKKMIAKKNKQEGLLVKQCVQINKNLHYMIGRVGFDKINSVIDGIVQRYRNSIKQLKTQLNQKNRHTMAKEHTITQKPNNQIIKQGMMKKLDPNESAQRRVILSLAFQLAKQGFSSVQKKEYFFTNLIQSFRMFAMCDEYVYMIELLRSQKKNIIKQIKAKPSQFKTTKELITKNPDLQQISKIYNLLDAHVYIKNNLWCQSSDCIYNLFQSSFDFISFQDILCLLEGAFYRSLFCHYIYAKSSKDGVLIPDYAMVHIEPNSKFKCQAKNKEFTKIEVLKLEYFQIELERPKNLNQIKQGLYWIDIFLKVMNSDVEALLNEKIYFRLYNMMITFLLNTTSAELKYNNEVVYALQTAANKFLNSPLDKVFRDCKLFLEIRYNYDKYFNDVKARGELKMYQLLLFQKSNQEYGGFVRVSSVWEYNKQTQDELVRQMDKAFYVEMNILARHYAAANYIQRIWRQIQLKQKDRVDREKANKADKELLNSQKYCLQIFQSIRNNFKIKEVQDGTLITACRLTGAAIESIDINLRQLIYSSISKLVYNSLDLHYLRAKINEAYDRRKEFLMNVRATLAKKQDIELIIGNLKEVAQISILETNELEKQLIEWMGKKAEPNIIELEKKQLNIRNKWETLVQFQKRKKVMLRHLTRNKK
eukprot:403362997